MCGCSFILSTYVEMTCLDSKWRLHLTENELSKCIIFNKWNEQQSIIMHNNTHALLSTAFYNAVATCIGSLCLVLREPVWIAFPWCHFRILYHRHHECLLRLGWSDRPSLPIHQGMVSCIDTASFWHRPQTPRVLLKLLFVSYVCRGCDANCHFHPHFACRRFLLN